ncbi:hypothetical protein E2C01_088647 [Portunus trituberculatus]|uniref:Uncharacterized protein n=1 Tax=Portunus trituberculatus TaxID=210409 RepID=A0A5B7JG10_PORTR|nr:hypothetical protein [Portunus trituberculatus]
MKTWSLDTAGPLHRPTTAPPSPIPAWHATPRPPRPASHHSRTPHGAPPRHTSLSTLKYRL